MEKRIIRITRGLPGSGKSTFAKKYVQDTDCRTQRVNRDDLRHMLNGYVLSWTNQAVILGAEKAIMKAVLLNGFDLIVDNMFLKSIEIKNLVKFCKEFEQQHPSISVQLELIDFTDVPLEECIRRDAARPTPTGETIIRELHEMFLEQNDEFLKVFTDYEYSRKK